MKLQLTYYLEGDSLRVSTLNISFPLLVRREGTRRELYLIRYNPKIKIK